MSLTPLESKKHIERLISGDITAYEAFYRGYFRYLKVIAIRYVEDDNQAADIVQETFLELWKRKDQLDIHTSVKSYLRRAVVNKSLNWIRIQDRWSSAEVGTDENFAPAIPYVDMEVEANDLNSYLGQVIQRLPARCRVIFTMSRFEDMSHKQIAEKLDISIKTVENQITKALKVMRSAVEAFDKNAY